MANDCMNYITIEGKGDMLQLFADSYLKKDSNGNYELNFDYITPIPKDCDDDYAFRIEHWGNKWDGTNAYIDFSFDENKPDDYGYISMTVDTAWAPCVPITRKLIDLCPALYFYHEYYEPGCGFLGWIEHCAGDEPDEYEAVEYDSSCDKYEYWFWMFEKEFETFDWLYEYVEEMKCDEEITEEVCNTIQKLIKENDEVSLIVEYCIEEGVLL